MRTLYTIVFLLLLPLFVLRLFWRARKAPAYALRIGERFARVPARPDSATLLWVHAVSVGEVIAATPMIRRLQQEHPHYAVCVTTTTPTGSDRVRAAFGNTVLHYYMPYDLPFLQRLFINAIRPAVLVVMETELWPNVIAMCHDKKIPVIVANARMSTSSARGYRRLAALTRPMLQQLSLIAAQSRADAQRFVYLGADRSKVRVTGSIKFDVRIDDVVRQRKSALLAQLQCQQRKVVVFASTHPGEDEQILPVIRRLHQQHAEFLAIVVPRHPERFDVVARLAQQLHMPLVRLSTGERCEASTSLVLGDTMGDMLAIYGLAQVAFVGGSLIARGGHNFLEAAAWGLPVFSGASVYNFQDVARLLLRQGGLRLLHDHVELESLLQDWLAGKADLAAMGTSALAVLESNRGALQKLLDAVEEVADIRQ